MTSRDVCNKVATLIREVDPDNMLIPIDLGAELAPRLMVYGLDRSRRGHVARFIARTNPDMRMGAGDLAELIVAEFGLDQDT